MVYTNSTTWTKLNSFLYRHFKMLHVCFVGNISYYLEMISQGCAIKHISILFVVSTKNILISWKLPMK